MAVCFCAKHLGNKANYDTVTVLEKEEEQPWSAHLLAGEFSHFPPFGCHTPLNLK